MSDKRSAGVLEPEWVPRCSLARGLAASAGAAFDGPLLGVGLASLVAPGSDEAGLASFFAFGGAFVLGMLSWLGLGVAAVVLAALLAILAGCVTGPRPGDASSRRSRSTRQAASPTGRRSARSHGAATCASPSRRDAPAAAAQPRWKAATRCSASMRSARLACSSA